MKKIIIIGAGAMGSAFAVPCVENKNDVTIVGTHLEDNLIKDIISNDHHHPGLKTKLPKEIKFVQLNELQPLLEKDLDLVVAGISSIGIEWFAKQISKNYKKKLPIVLLTKGLSIVENELSTLSDKIKNLLEKEGHSEINISAIKGPCLAAGLANKMRTGTVIANKNLKESQYLKEIISTSYYSTEISEDINGIELSGAIKNIYSMIIGAGQSLNASSNLFQKSIIEMNYLTKYFKGKEETTLSLAGVGDLYVSAAGGRNSKMGSYLGKGFTFKIAKKRFMPNDTVEGEQLAKEIAPFILKRVDKKKIPLMINLLRTIIGNKKLKIKV